MKRPQSGFTLVELLVVVLIIGLLAYFGIPQYFKLVERSRASEITDVMPILSAAEDRYFNNNGSYTNDFTALDIVIPNADGQHSGPMGSGSGHTWWFMGYTVGYTQSFAVTLENASTSSYQVMFGRNAETAYYGNYIIFYNCSVGTGCVASEYTGFCNHPGECLDLINSN